MNLGEAAEINRNMMDIDGKLTVYDRDGLLNSRLRAIWDRCGPDLLDIIREHYDSLASHQKAGVFRDRETAGDHAARIWQTMLCGGLSLEDMRKRAAGILA